jgi:alpha-maltose-1-phosphate synthase
MYHPDVIHVQGSYGIYTGELLANGLRCPLVGTAHLLHESLFSAVAAAAPSYLVDFDRRLCESVDILITVSSFLASEVRELGLRTKKPICVIQNGTSMPSKRGNHADLVDRCPGGSSQARKNIVTVGRLVPQKGILQLLQSAAIVIDECPHLRYLLIGARYDEPFCRTLDSYLAERPAVRQAVVFLGAIPQDDIWDFYRNSYMVVLPSLYESFGLSALEAMYCGAPVIASAVGGLEEVIVHENSGLLLRPILTDGGLSIDPTALAQLQLRLLRDPELAKQMGANGAERARTVFSEESMAIHTLACYELALAQAVTLN